jgi:hypothetical protein
MKIIVYTLFHSTISIYLLTLTQMLSLIIIMLPRPVLPILRVVNNITKETYHGS